MESTMKADLKKLEEQMHIQSRTGDLNRARSVVIGTAFGGVTELSMRTNDKHVWCLLQPVEVIELIHQMAASVGCHIHIQPRKDFSSWRNWKYTEEELRHFRGEQLGDFRRGEGHAPHVKGWHENQHTAAALPTPEQQPGLNIERKDHEPVATKKTVNRRSTKRAAAST
jgi:hypothetical protein